MKIIGAVLCLFLIIPVGGMLRHAEALAKTKSLASEKPDAADLMAFLQRARSVFNAGKYDEAAELYSRGYQLSLESGDGETAVQFRIGVGSCELARFQYQQALANYLSARNLLRALGKEDESASVDIGLSSVYSQLGEYEAAMAAARDGLKRILKDGDRAKLLVLQAVLEANRGRLEEARALFREGIEEADRVGDLDLLSNAEDKLGTALLLRKQYPQAEEALLAAYHIRKLNHLPGLGWSYRNLGLLRMERGDWRSASALLEAALSESRTIRGMIPEWRVYQARGQLRLAEGKLREAEADFRLALELARDYRLTVPVSDATRVSAEDFLQQLYSSFAETGSALYFRKPDEGMARETFEAVEENRAGSLAARLDERAQLRRRLPPAYWEALGRLEAAESAALLDGGEGPRQEVRRIRASLIEMEAAAGSADFPYRGELLERVRGSLDADTALLTFHLGRDASSLWAVSRSGLALYRLAGRESIERQILAFRSAVAEDRADGEILGRRLYQTLFGSLSREYAGKKRWLLSLDEGMFDLPFAALIAASDGARPVYLVERHSLQIVSGASTWAGRGGGGRQTGGKFIGVGDAIYNTADLRWREEVRAWGWLYPWTGEPPVSGGPALSRLPASGLEVEGCAREWGARSELLEGRDATKENVRLALAARPAIVHFATHVLPGRNPGENAMIALSAGDKGKAELLGPAEIGGWDTEVGLIVLSGCGSGVAQARPGAGLMGLTRAWLMGGARAVVATRWQTPDDVGIFFRRFYGRLRGSAGLDPAGALQAAQVETIQSRDWRSRPAFWAAYFALGNY